MSVMSDTGDLPDPGEIQLEVPGIGFDDGIDIPDGNEVVVLGDDGEEYVVLSEDDIITEEEPDFDDNLAELMTEAELEVISADLLTKIEYDKSAREKRDKQYQEGLRRTGMGDDAPGGADFEGASKAVHPVMAECTVEFASSTIKELFPPNGPVRVKIDGTVTAGKIERANRMRKHMNWQLTQQMSEYRYELEQLLTQLPLSGGAYMKFWYDEGERRPRAEFVPLDDIYIPFSASSLYSADRFTHRFVLTEQQFEGRVGSMYCAHDYYGPPQDPVMNESKSEIANEKIEGKSDTGMNVDGDREIYEVYAKYDVEGQGALPYIITIDVSSRRICSIYRNWEETDDRFRALDHIIEFPFIPWRGAYPVGLPHLIGGLSAAATGALRGLLDSAHINNIPTAIRLKGSGASGQTIYLKPGTIPEIPDAGADDIRKVVMPIPFNPPSQMLFQLLGYIDEAARRTVGPIKAQLQDFAKDSPVGSVQSFVEAGSKVYSSVFARLHFAQARALSVLARLNKYYLNEEDILNEFGEQVVTQADYQKPHDLAPVSDPNIFTETQRYAQSQTIVQMMSAAPELYNARAVHYRVLNQSGIDKGEIDEILPPPDEPTDENPVAENVKMLLGQPALALPDQDHLAHLQVLLDAVKSPVLGGSPAYAGVFVPLAVEHAKQHIAYFYAQRMMDAANAASEMDVASMPIDSDDVRIEMSRLLAGVSPLVIEDITSSLGQGSEIVAAAAKFIQENAPKPPIDPGAAAIEAQRMETERLTKSDQTEAQLKQVEIQTDAQIEQAKLAAAERKTAIDNETKLQVALIKEQSKSVKPTTKQE